MRDKQKGKNQGGEWVKKGKKKSCDDHAEKWAEEEERAKKRLGRTSAGTQGKREQGAR